MSIILCLDAGNSRLKWGLHDSTRWLRQGALAYEELEQLPVQWPARPDRIVACNVAGDAVRQQITALAAELGLPLRWLTSSAAAYGVINGYDQPTQLGADRWAALIGARSLYAGPLVVVMAGTATTIDQLDGDGLFRGGLILPGLELMRRALARDTANLPFAKGGFQMTPKNTDDAIVSGSLHATLGAIDRMQASLGQESRLILSGGAAPMLAQHCPESTTTVENLVLEGLFCFESFDTTDRPR